MKTFLRALVLFCLLPSAQAQNWISSNGGSIGNRNAPRSRASTTPTPTALTVDEAQQEAIRRHPDLAVAGSALNTAFVKLYKARQATRSDCLSSPNWPILLADEAAAESKSNVSLITYPSADPAIHWGAEGVFGHFVARVPGGGVLVQASDRVICIRGLPNETKFADGDLTPLAWSLPDGNYEYTAASMTVHVYQAMTQSAAAAR